MSRLLLVSSSRIHGRGYLDHCAPAVQEQFRGAGRVLFVPHALHDRDGYAARAADRFAELDLELVPLHTASDPVAAVEQVDGVFIGPSDLSASLGHIGNAGHPEVVAAIKDALDRLKAIGVPAGILAVDPTFARQCIDWGFDFTAVGVDAVMLAKASSALRESFR